LPSRFTRFFPLLPTLDGDFYACGLCSALIISTIMVLQDLKVSPPLLLVFGEGVFFMPMIF
jgi:predicted PP-loop superfamily ATPase